MLSLSHGAPRVLHCWHRSISDSTASARAVAVSEAVRTARCTASPPAAPRQPSPLTGGQAQGHAGTVTMAARRDALAAAAEVMVWLERRCGDHSLDDVPPEALEDPSLVCTVGEVGVHPGVSNVIARYANISVDIRRAPWGCSDRVGYWVRLLSTRAVPLHAAGAAGRAAGGALARAAQRRTASGRPRPNARAARQGAARRCAAARRHRARAAGGLCVQAARRRVHGRGGARRVGGGMRPGHDARAAERMHPLAAGALLRRS